RDAGDGQGRRFRRLGHFPPRRAELLDRRQPGAHRGQGRHRIQEQHGMTEVFRFAPGSTPVLISIPHAGTQIPAELAARMTGEALALPDTDWHVERLYDFATSLGAGLIVATHSRYVVDLNRDPSGKPLYAGADNTELVPLSTFAREAVYRPGLAPDDAEVAQRVARYWKPYHDRIAAELAALKARFGVAVLWDAHSIPSV